MVPFEDMDPGAVRTAVPCQVEVAPLGLVTDPLVVAVWVALFQLVWDCQLPVPPAAFVHWPFLVTSPWARVVTDDEVPVPPLLSVWVPVRVISLPSSARAALVKAIATPARMAMVTNLKRGSFFI